MGNVLLAYPDRLLDSASYSTVLSGGSWLGTLPITSLKNPLLSAKARSTNALAASTKFDADLGVARAIRVIAILRHNFSAAATIQVRGYSDAGYTSLVWDSTALAVWPEGYPAVENKKRYQEDFYILLPSDQTARYWRTEILDTANPAGYAELARAIFMPAFQPAVNFVWGHSVGIETDTTQTRSRGGVDYYDRKEPRRVTRFALPYLSQSEAFGQVFEMQWDRGIDKEVLFVYDPADTGVMLKKRSWLATLRELSPIEFPYLDGFSAAVELLEIM